MLIVQFLIDKFFLFYVSEISFPEVILINNRKYSIDKDSKENLGFIGFFDWLRKNESSIVGIRISFFEHHGYNKILSNFAYLNVVDGNCELLFVNENYKQEISGDQDFTNNFVYMSEDNQPVFTFGLDHLSKDELDSLLAYCDNTQLVICK